MLLKDKIVVISGIGPGLGVKLAVEAAREGARGIVVAARTAHKLDDAEARIAALGVDCDVLKVTTDITERAQCRQLADAAIGRFGRIDALVNSAFVHGAFPEPVDAADLDGWRAVFDTNVFGTMALTQEVVPHMKRQRRGAIVMINTQATRKPFAGEAGYAVSKGRSRLRQNTWRASSACTASARTASTWGGCGACRRRRISGRPRPSMACRNSRSSRRSRRTSRSRGCRPTTTARAPRCFSRPITRTR